MHQSYDPLLRWGLDPDQPGLPGAGVTVSAAACPACSHGDGLLLDQDPRTLSTGCTSFTEDFDFLDLFDLTHRVQKVGALESVLVSGTFTDLLRTSLRDLLGKSWSAPLHAPLVAARAARLEELDDERAAYLERVLYAPAPDGKLDTVLVLSVLSPLGKAVRAHYRSLTDDLALVPAALLPVLRASASGRSAPYVSAPWREEYSTRVLETATALLADSEMPLAGVLEVARTLEA